MHNFGKESYFVFIVYFELFIKSAFSRVSFNGLAVLSTCPLHTNSGCGKERRILIGPW